MKKLKLISAEVTSAAATGAETCVIFELEIARFMCSVVGPAHGGCLATVAAITTTMAAAPLCREGYWEFGGVSNILTITFLRPVLQNSVIVIEAMVRNAGKRLCAIECIMRDKATGKVLVLAQHNKAALDRHERRRRAAVL
ncbi:hypothetical protein CERZMDRAFT_48715 [Cercospora zeae-maydis SCOH1-5]|uniref:Thioesterase domain-containing protein n=1 Tax=Cercospora zeae-maydis SCOH1-5 TaxID=717836 RepID=A0A6A6F606_9PEZI|nr:hypothetical protein CERZMDRAFT_48715 [Cercospora zeae-maydis SCOH1-5]